MYTYLAGYDRPDGRHVEGCWKWVDPSPFVGGWHLQAISEHLEAVIDHVTGKPGGIPRLLINVPPRTGKSTTTSVAWPTHTWINHPEIRFLFTSYAERLAVRDARKSRQLLNTMWYQARFGDSFTLLGDQNEKSRYENDKGGYRLSTSFGGSSTGEGGDIVVADDPHKADDAINSDQLREDVVEEWQQTYSSRLNDPDRGAFVVIMQRLHEADLSGHLVAESGYVHLCLPMTYSPRHPFICPEHVEIPWAITDDESGEELTGVRVLTGDPRTEEGELLQPDRFSARAVAALTKDMTPLVAAGQLDQLPAPEKGDIFQREHLEQFWVPGKPEACTSCETLGWFICPTCKGDGRVKHGDESRACSCLEGKRVCPRCRGAGDVNYYPKVSETALSWDMAFKDTKTSSFVVGAVWGRQGAKKYLLDLVRDKMDFPTTVRAFKAQVARWPEATTKLVEDKANGPAVIATLKAEIGGIIPQGVEGSKVARARAVSPQFEAHDIYIPHPSIAPWIGTWIDEHLKFPNGTHDDQVDTTSQILLRWGTKATGVGLSELKVWE
jgi:predicted phage terminase large subunit-like protein